MNCFYSRFKLLQIMTIFCKFTQMKKNINEEVKTQNKVIVPVTVTYH